MSKLVPVKRLDKNNRLVTRYVLPEGNDSSVKVPAPSLHLNPAEQRKEDAVFCYNIPGLDRHSYLSVDVEAGDILLSDVIAAGGSNLRHLSGYVLRESLRTLSSGTDKYTAEDIGHIMTKLAGNNVEAEGAVKLLMRFGAEFTGKIKSFHSLATAINHNMDVGIHSDEYIKSVILYVTEYAEEDKLKNGIYGITPKIEEYMVYHDARILPHDVVNKHITIEQARAVLEGKTSTAIAEGWL